MPPSVSASRETMPSGLSIQHLVTVMWSALILIAK